MGDGGWGKLVQPPSPIPYPLLGEPADNRVAGEADHAAAEAIDFGDQRVVDVIDLMDKLLDAAARAKLAGQHIAERREAGDIGEQRRAAGSVGQCYAACHGRAAIRWDVSAQGMIHDSVYPGGST